MEINNKKKFCLSRRIEEYHYVQDDSSVESIIDDDNYSSIFKLIHQQALKKSRILEIEEKFNNEIQNRFNNHQLTYDDYSSNLTSNDYSIKPNLINSKLITSTPKVNLSILKPINKITALSQIETPKRIPISSNIHHHQNSIRKTNYMINNNENECHNYQIPFTNARRRKSSVNFRRQSTIPFERVRRLANDSPYMSPLSPDPQKNRPKPTTIFKSYFEIDRQTPQIEYHPEKSLTINDLNSNNGNKLNSQTSLISFSKAFVDEPEDFYSDQSDKKNEFKLNEFTTSNKETLGKSRSTNNLNKSIDSLSFEPPKQNNKRSTLIPNFNETTSKSTNRINGSRKSIAKNSEIISELDDSETLSNRKSRSKSLINLSNSTKYQESINNHNKKSTRKSITQSKLNSEIKSNVKNSEILTNQFEETSGIVSKSNNSTKRSKKSMNTSSELVSGLKNTIKNSEIETLSSNETQEEDDEDEKLSVSINNSRKSKKSSRQLSIRKNSSTQKSLKSTLKSLKSVFDQEDVTDKQNSISLLNESEIESIKPSTYKQNTSIKSSTPYLSSKRISSNALLSNEAVPINYNSAIDSIKNNDTSSIVSNTSKSKNNLINTSLKSTRRSSKTSSDILGQLNGRSEIVTQANDLSEIETNNGINSNEYSDLTNDKNSEIKTTVSTSNQFTNSQKKDLSAKLISKAFTKDNLTNNDKNSEIVSNIIKNSEIVSNINESDDNESSFELDNNLSKISSDIKSNIDLKLSNESSQVNSNVDQNIKSNFNSEINSNFNSKLSNESSQINSNTNQNIKLKFNSDINSNFNSELCNESSSQISSNSDQNIKSKFDSQIQLNNNETKTDDNESSFELDNNLSKINSEIKSNIDSKLPNESLSQINSNTNQNIKLNFNSEINSNFNSELCNESSSQINSNTNQNIKSKFDSQIQLHTNETKKDDNESSFELDNNLSKINSEIKSNINSKLPNESSQVNSNESSSEINSNVDQNIKSKFNSEIFSNNITVLDNSTVDLEKEKYRNTFRLSIPNFSIDDYELNEDLNSKIINKNTNNDNKYSKISDDEEDLQNNNSEEKNSKHEKDDYNESFKFEITKDDDDESRFEITKDYNESKFEITNDYDEESRLDITKDTTNESTSQLKNNSFSRIEPTNFSRISVSFEPSINNSSENYLDNETSTNDKEQNEIDKDNFKIPKLPSTNRKHLKATSRQTIAKQPSKYYETILNKTPTIIYPEEEEEQDNLIRRSNRIRVKPLEFWRNQKLKYKVDKETKCFTIEGLEKGFKSENPFSKKFVREPQKSNKRKLKEYKKKSKLPKIKEEDKGSSSTDEESENETSDDENIEPVKKKRYLPSEESIHQNINESALIESEKIKQEAAEFFTKSDLIWKPSRQSEGVFIALMNRKKSSKTGTQASGFLKMEPFAEKPTQESSNYVTKYVVMFGAISVQIGDKADVFLKSMDSFRIEQNTKYSISNLRKDEALLYFDVCRSN